MNKKKKMCFYFGAQDAPVQTQFVAEKTGRNGFEKKCCINELNLNYNYNKT